MPTNPYEHLPTSAYWKTGVTQENPYKIQNIYRKKFNIEPTTKIATAGSCFAQHISHYLKKNGYNVLDLEQPPPSLPQNLHQRFGFSMYSARYGNIYTVRQLLQLAQEVAGKWTPNNYIWEKKGRFFDALRPGIEPNGFNSRNEVIQHRKFHICKVRELFKSFDLLIFTLGLTEMWVDKSGTVYPTAPGTIAGKFDKESCQFKNAQFIEIKNDFNKFQRNLREIRNDKDFKIILTVSPVPLTATASNNHVLTSTIYSKSILRSVAGQLATNQQHIDYFPSYEIATNPRMHSMSYEHNLRTIRGEAVENIMNHFFAEHPPINIKKENKNLSKEYNNSSIKCEEELIEAFGR